MVVGYLNDHGYPHAERRRLKGSKDEGDIAGIPGVVIEVKGDRAMRIAEWRRETTVETVNANSPFGFLVVRRANKPTGEWDAHLPLGYLCGTDLLDFAITGDVWVRMDLKDAVDLMKAQDR